MNQKFDKLSEYVRYVKENKLQGEFEVIDESEHSHKYKTTYKLSDGVEVVYFDEYDDGSPYPGCKLHDHYWIVGKSNGFQIENDI
jgi:hypothetical protein